MRQQHITRINVAAMRIAADQFDAGVDILDNAVRAQLARLEFGGASAGRDHVAEGDAVRHTLDRLAGELTLWARASAEIAAALRAGVQRYVDAEICGAARIG